MEETKENSLNQLNKNKEKHNIDTDNPLNYESYLEKKARNLFSGWQKRYFVLLEGKIIIYTESKESKIVKGYISIKQISDIKSLEENSFSIDTEGRTFLLKADNQNVKNDWLEKIKNSFMNVKKGSLKHNGSSLDKNKILEALKKNDEKSKLNSISKKLGNLIEKYGYILNKEEDTDSKKLLEKYSINKLIKLDEKNILNHIKYGFMFKKQKVHDAYNKRWFFLFSRGCLKNSKNNDDSTYLEDNNQKEWLQFDTLYYFRYDKDKNDKDGNIYDAQIKMEECHKITNLEKEEKYIINIDYKERLYEFYCDTKIERDEWFEALINSRKTSKTYKFSITKHPKNVDQLYKIFTKDKNAFVEKIKTEFDEAVGKIEDISEFKIFEYIINKLRNLIESNMDGCICSIPIKIDLLKSYADYMNKEYLNIYKKFWESSYDKINKDEIITLGVMLLNYNEEVNKFNVYDINLLKNGKEFVKIYFKSMFYNNLYSIENMLKYEIESKGNKDGQGIYYSEGPKIIFDIIFKMLELIKDFKHKIIFNYLLKIVNMSIFQYCYGINCVISNQGVIIEDEYLITVSNDTLSINQLLNNFIENFRKINILTEEEINEEIQKNNLINIIDKLTFNAMIYLVYEHKDELEKDFEEQKFLKIEIDNIIKKSNYIYGKYKSMMNSRVTAIFYNEILKLTLCYYITRLLLITNKKKRKKEEIIDKIKRDKDIIFNTYKDLIGEDLSITTLKLLDDIIGILEIDKTLISTTILAIREYIGPAFTYGVAKKLIKLRSDLSKEEKIDCKNQCEEVLNSYEGPKGETSSYFQLLSSKIKKNSKDKKYLKIKESKIKYGDEIEQNEENSNDESDEGNKSDDSNSDLEEEEVKNVQLNIDGEENYIKTNMENFFKDNEDDIEDEKDKEEEESEMREDFDENLKPDLDGYFYKKANASYKKYYFQIKNCGLYWFEDQKTTTAKNKLSLKNVVIVNSDKKPTKFLLKNSNENDKEYRFKCNTEEEKNALVESITKSINNSKEIKNTIQIPKIEIKERKKIIKDYLKSNNKIKGTYIEDKILEYLKTGKYFKINKQKMEKVLKNNMKKKQKEKEKEKAKEKNKDKEKDGNSKNKKATNNKIKNIIKGK